jgi:hypothetical protein
MAMAFSFTWLRLADRMARLPATPAAGEPGSVNETLFPKY